MDATEQHVNGTASGGSLSLGERLLAALDSLPEGLPEAERLTHYQLLRPDLADLYESEPVTFDLVAKAATKKLRVKLGAIRQDVASMLPPKEPTPEAQPEAGPSQATRLVALAADAELFHTPDREGWATITVDGHQEHWPLKVKAFRRYLARRFYEKEKKAPGSQALQDALGVLEGKALFEGSEYPVFTRVADYNGSIYIDLCNDNWGAIETTAAGWRVVDTPPIRFRRTKGMLPLPQPEEGGSVSELHQFVNVEADTKETLSTDWVLLVAWLLAAFRPHGPYPVLELNGEQGSAKSTLARILRSLIDPSSAPLRTVPREERDLMISANAGWTLAFDNLSYLPQWLSDAFCRLATGGGFATRELYTDADETLFDAQRPVLLTGIEDLAVNGDLLDRSVPLVLPAVPEHQRKPESVFWQEFEAVRPRILGALLDVVAAALHNLPTVKLKRLPRMADFAVWVTAAEPALGWKAGTFLAAYNSKRAATNDLALDASLVAAAVRKLIEEKPWEGTAGELLTAINNVLLEKDTKAKQWPKNPLALSNILRRLAPNLRVAGTEVIFSRSSGKNSKRLIMIRTMPETTVASDASVAPNDTPRDFTRDSPQDEATLRNGGASHGDGRASHDQQDATQGDTEATQDSQRASPKNLSKNGHGDAGDAGDAPLRTHSDGTSTIDVGGFNWPTGEQTLIEDTEVIE